MVDATIGVSDVHSLLAVTDSSLCGLKEIFRTSARSPSLTGSPEKDGSVACSLAEAGVNQGEITKPAMDESSTLLKFEGSGGEDALPNEGITGSKIHEIGSRRL